MRIWNKLFVAQAIGRSQRTPFKANTPESKRLKKNRGRNGSKKGRYKGKQPEQNYKLPKYQKKFLRKERKYYIEKENYNHSNNTHNTIK